MKYDYYYNNVPGIGLTRNNLVYTSLISQDKKIFVMWFYNDSEYHQGQNEVVDPKLMEEKWYRELRYLTLMNDFYPEYIPKIADINHTDKKIYLEIEGLDFWNRAGCLTENYNSVLPDWQQQMLDIVRAHKNLGLYKYSMHPSSYFIVDGKLKSINYFFCYHEDEGPISIADHSSHIYSTRQDTMKEKIKAMGLDWNKPEPLDRLQLLCFESFRSNYTNSFVDSARKIYSD